MKKLRKNLLVSVKASDTLFPTTFLKAEIERSDPEIIGKIFRVLPGYVELILSHNDRNMTIYNATKLKLFKADDKIFRLATEEEKVYWRNNDKTYSFSTNIKYESELTLVNELVFTYTLIHYLKSLLIRVKTTASDTDCQRIAKFSEMSAILETSTILGGKLLELNKSVLNSVKTAFNKFSAIDYIPTELFRLTTLSTIIHLDWDNLWEHMLYQQRMWNYRSHASNLTLKI